MIITELQSATSEEAIKEMAVMLHHNHLPHLDDTNIIDYDRESNPVISARIDRLTLFFDGCGGDK